MSAAHQVHMPRPSPMPTFHRFDPSDCSFPAPRVPLLPELRWRDFGLRRGAAAHPFDSPGARHFARGRYALREAFRTAGIGPQTALLAPSYHCRTMFDPALALGGQVLFYAVDDNLHPDLASIAALLEEAATPVRALLVTHYFGFRQPASSMDALAALCLRNGVTLVEDCSHAFQVALEQGPACREQSGRMVVASPYKFFAAPDGGTLWGSAAPAPSGAQQGPGLLAETKALLQALARARPGVAVNAAAPASGPAARGSERIETGELISPNYDREQEQMSSLALSRVLVRHARLQAVAAQRRDNYRRWLSAIAGLRGCHALWTELPPDCAPYMFPLLIEKPDPHFFQLKQLGMPIWRWDDMAAAGCPVADHLRLHLLHLPCHQSLTGAQMAWMTKSLAAVVVA